jgi:glutathione peroxidase
VSVRRIILKSLYPTLMKVSRNSKKGAIALNERSVPPVVPIFALDVMTTDGRTLPLEQFRGRFMLIVNTASDCGYTAQYAELQQLSLAIGDGLTILGFPANDFGGQEPGGDATIAQFCSLKYGVTFPLMKKTSVVGGAGQHPVFRWLTDPASNGWNNREPEWNFTKYLVRGDGTLMGYFGSAISPLSEQILSSLDRKVSS